MHELLNNPEVQRLLAPDTGLLFAVWETMYMTVVSTLFAYVIGLPLAPLMRMLGPGIFRTLDNTR